MYCTMYPANSREHIRYGVFQQSWSKVDNNKHVVQSRILYRKTNNQHMMDNSSTRRLQEKTARRCRTGRFRNCICNKEVGRELTDIKVDGYE